MNVLVLNCGSSSVKFRLIATDLDLIAQNADRRLAKGTIERIGGEAKAQKISGDIFVFFCASLWLQSFFPASITSLF